MTLGQTHSREAGHTVLLLCSRHGWECECSCIRAAQPSHILRGEQSAHSSIDFINNDKRYFQATGGESKLAEEMRLSLSPEPDSVQMRALAVDVEGRPMRVGRRGPASGEPRSVSGGGALSGCGVRHSRWVLDM